MAQFLVVRTGILFCCLFYIFFFFFPKVSRLPFYRQGIWSTKQLRHWVGVGTELQFSVWEPGTPMLNTSYTPSEPEVEWSGQWAPLSLVQEAEGLGGASVWYGKLSSLLLTFSFGQMEPPLLPPAPKSKPILLRGLGIRGLLDLPISGELPQSAHFSGHCLSDSHYFPMSWWNPCQVWLGPTFISEPKAVSNWQSHGQCMLLISIFVGGCPGPNPATAYGKFFPDQGPSRPLRPETRKIPTLLPWPLLSEPSPTRKEHTHRAAGWLLIVWFFSVVPWLLQPTCSLTSLFYKLKSNLGFFTMSPLTQS